MTISTVHVRNDYPNVGSQLVFPYTFKIFAETDIQVIETNESTGVSTVLTLTTDYTVSGINADAGGNVTLTAPRGTGRAIAIVAVLDRENTGVGLPITQSTDLVNETGFFQDRIETRFDRLARQTQILVEESGRAVSLPISEAADAASLQLPSLQDRKGKFLGFDPTTGALIAAQPAGAPVSAAMQPVLAANTLSLATQAFLSKRQSGRINMGFQAIGDVFAIGGQSSTSSFVRGLQIGGGDSNEGPDGVIENLEGHSTWRRFVPSRNYASIEVAIHPTAASGSGRQTVGTNQITRLQGSEFSAAWIGRKIYFNEQIYRVATVPTNSLLTVTTVGGGPVSFASTLDETYHVCYVYGSGTCNVTGTAVTRVTGDPFIIYNTSPSFSMKINGAAVTASIFNSTDSYTLSSAPGNGSGLPFEFWVDINDQITTFRLHKSDADVENLSLYSRYDGYWIESQFGSYGKHRAIRLSSGERTAGVKFQQVVVWPNGDTTIGGDYTSEAVRILATSASGRANYLVTQAAGGGFAPGWRSRGSDANIDFSLDAQGDGALVFTNGSFGRTAFRATAAAGDTSYIETNASSSNAPQASARGSAADIDFALTPKGAGRVRFGTFTVNSDAPIIGFITIKDSGGTARKLAIIA